MNEMCWMSIGNLPDREKILHLNINGVWKPYSQTKVAVADYQIAHGSKGYSTMQKLIKQGWRLVPAPQQAGDPGFKLVEVEGEPISETIIAERSRDWSDIYGFSGQEFIREKAIQAFEHSLEEYGDVYQRLADN